METTHVPRSGSSEVAGDNTLDTHFLRGADDIFLVRNSPWDDRVDKNIHTAEVRLQFFNTVVHVTNANLHTGGTQRLHLRFAGRRRPDQCPNALPGTIESVRDMGEFIE